MLRRFLSPNQTDIELMKTCDFWLTAWQRGMPQKEARPKFANLPFMQSAENDCKEPILPAAALSANGCFQEV
jgi:hypothetical protein|tara:strand:+ start:289 stop:504 length:216 start_codon:yes stop_codon:yes gene_type:complete